MRHVKLEDDDDPHTETSDSLPVNSDLSNVSEPITDVALQEPELEPVNVADEEIHLIPCKYLHVKGWPKVIALYYSLQVFDKVN